MQEQFLDRILTCVDCHGEFIFTAGEQLFFFDKQFKNDPKRCKPCKSRRSGLAAAANGTGPVAAGLSRTETRTQCSECGIETTVPFKPTQGRPVLCRQCFQLKNRGGVVAVEAPAPGLAVASIEPSLSVVTAPPSSVATPEDLAYVASLDQVAESSVPASVPASVQATARLTAQLIAGGPAELHAPVPAAPELQAIAAEATQA
jgi:CxxC-x17-CxxC domain-containing protein